MRIALILALGLVSALALGGWWVLVVDQGSESRKEARRPSSDYRLDFVPCDFEAPWRADIRCARLKTPARSQGEPQLQFQLPVVIIRAQSPDRRPDPIFYLQGGPGAPARLDREGIEGWLSWLDYGNIQRDLVLMDRRGAGRSEPALDCPEYRDYHRRILNRDLSQKKQEQSATDILQGCYQRLVEQGKFDIEAFGTRANARDAAALMQRLDYPVWNLLGVSYGSRLAMAIARQPEAQGLVRSLVLDSVYPADQGGMLSWPRIMTEGLERFLSWCSREPGLSHEVHPCTPPLRGSLRLCKSAILPICPSQGRDLNTELDQALARLAEEPLTVTVNLWRERRPVQMLVNDQRFLSAIFSAVYSEHRWHQIPAALAGLQEGDREPLANLFEPKVNQALGGQVSSLVFMAVDCRDHPLGSAEDYQAQLQQYPRFQSYLAPLWAQQSCQWLGAGAQPLSRSLPIEVPALLLAGALDPITPAQWARDLEARWPKSQLHLVPDTGHSVLGSRPQLQAQLSQFLDKPTRPWPP